MFVGADHTVGERLGAGLLHVAAHGGRAGAPRAARRRGGRWNVPVAELTTGPSVVVHRKSGRASPMARLRRSPGPGGAPKMPRASLKKPSQFRLIGRRTCGRVDVPAKVERQRHTASTSGAGHGLRATLHAARWRAPAEPRQHRRGDEDQGRDATSLRRRSGSP